MDVRNAKGEKVELVVGMWYVGVNWEQPIYINKGLPCNDRGEPLGLEAMIARDDTGRCDYGAIAQYVGDGEFYDQGCDEPTDFNAYEYIVESHMGKIAA